MPPIIVKIAQKRILTTKRKRLSLQVREKAVGSSLIRLVNRIAQVSPRQMEDAAMNLFKRAPKLKTLPPVPVA